MGFDIRNASGTVHLDVWTWPIVLDLAVEHGWQPLGTEAPPPAYARVPADDAEAVGEALELGRRVADEAWSPQAPAPELEIDPPQGTGPRYRWILCEADAEDEWGGTYLTIQRQTIGVADGIALAASLRSALGAWDAAAESLIRARRSQDARLAPPVGRDGVPVRPSPSAGEVERIRRRLADLVELLEAGPATIA